MTDIPDDENGDVLRRMIAKGDDLSRVRIVDFTHVFPDEASAQAFAVTVEADGLFAVIAMTGMADDLPWDVVIEHPLAPNHAAVTTLELQLGEMAEKFGGRADGWGCEAVVDDSALMRPLR